MIKRILTAFAALAATLTVSAAEYDGENGSAATMRVMS